MSRDEFIDELLKLGFHYSSDYPHDDLAIATLVAPFPDYEIEIFEEEAVIHNDCDIEGKLRFANFNDRHLRIIAKEANQLMCQGVIDG